MDMQESSLRMKLNNQVIDEETIEYCKRNLTQCYYDIVQFIKRYMDIKEDYAKIISIWIIGTYFHEKLPSYPYLFFNAMRGSGKTRLLKLISSLGAKGDGSVQNNLTEAVLFRISKGTTTCIDEVEQIGSKEKQTLRELLNSAYKKGMKVKRMRKSHTKDGEMQVVETFEPYFPIAMANIWGMDEVLGDRSITILLEKSDNSSITKKVEDFSDNLIVKTITTLILQGKCCLCSVINEKILYEWNDFIDAKYTTTYTTYTTQTTQTTPIGIEKEEFFNKLDNLGISGRNFELLLPLLLVAKEINNGVFEEICKIGSEIMAQKKDEEYSSSKDVLVYDFIASLEEENKYHRVKELASHFRMFVGEEEGEDKWMNDRWLGRALKRLCLETEKKRANYGILVKLNYKKAKEKLKIFKPEEKK